MRPSWMAAAAAWTVAGAALGLNVRSASATVLTFDFSGTDGQTVPSLYGHRVGDPAFPTPSGWSYGSAGGATPNVGVVYGQPLNLGAPTNLTRIFGDLQNVIYRNRFASPPGILTFGFVADPGWHVSIEGFDIAAITDGITGQGEDLPARAIQVFREPLAEPIWAVNFDPGNPNRDSPTTTWAPGGLPLRHKHFGFAPGALAGESLILRMDLTQLITIGGNWSDYVGIDNIQISQFEVPGPCPVVLAYVGAGTLAFRRRRRMRV